MPGVFAFTPSADLRARLLADPGIALVPERLSVYHRFTGHGNRDWESQVVEHDLLLGVRGRLPAWLGYDLSLRSYRHAHERNGGNFVSEGLIRAAIEDGRYDLENPLSPEEGHRSAVRETRLRQLQDQLYRRSTARAALDGIAFALPGGPARWTADTEVYWLEQHDRVVYRDSGGTAHDDALSAGDDSYAGERRTWSLFSELELPLHRDWTVTLATRRDDYRDVGAAWSYRAASVWRPHKVLSIRGSWSAGGRPPGFRALHATESSAFPDLCDTVSYTGPLADCDSLQVETVFRGNPELKPDKVHAWSLGASARLGFLTLGADWFRFETADAPGRMATQTLIDLEAAGRPRYRPAPPSSAMPAGSRGSSIRWSTRVRASLPGSTSGPTPDGRPASSTPASRCTGSI